MPYEQYLSSANTSAYLSATRSRSTNYTFIYTGNITESAGIYGNAKLQTGTYYNPPPSGGGASASGAELISEIGGTTYGNNSFTASGATTNAYNGNNEDAYGNQGMESYRTISSFTASGSWIGTEFTSTNASTYSTSFTTGGTNNTGEVYGNSDSGETVVPAAVGIRDYFFDQITIETSSSVAIRKTTEGTSTLYGPLEDSEATYTYIIETQVEHTFSGIKTLTNSRFYWDLEYLTKSYGIEWLGYAGGGVQNLGLIYTETGEDKDISQYDSVLMETDSFFSSNRREVFSYGASFSDEYNGDTYTLTYDIITTSAVGSQTTTLERASVGFINSFLYGFIKTNTTNTTIYTAGTSSESIELVSYSKQPVFIYDTDGIFTVYGVSYSNIQTILTISNFTEFVELSGLNKATSFIVRSFVTTTAPYTYRTNNFAVTAFNDGNPNGNSYTFGPAFPESALVIRSPESTNPDTFYTEEASFASFAEPDYLTAYKNYSPANCSLVFLALIALNSESYGYGDTEREKYPSWISVYNGTFAGDRAITSNESVTVYQSSSYVGSGATNVYQTITYFINNNASSQTTKTTSIAMALVNQASLVSRLARTAVENLDSAYINSYLPSIPIDGLAVFFTQGLQGDASYNMDGRLLNAYTTAKSTFADSATSSFPISISTYYLDKINKIRIDSVYGAIPNNTFQTGLLRYVNFYDE
jgi:hypothetical protein